MKKREQDLKIGEEFERVVAFIRINKSINLSSRKFFLFFHTRLTIIKIIISVSFSCRGQVDCYLLLLFNYDHHLAEL